jgi:putative ABC transport system substrate-binding protein
LTVSVIDRRAFLAGSLAVFAAPLTGEAQQAKVYRIGFLGAGSAATAQPNLEALRQGLAELGWVEGENVVIEYRFTEGRYDRLPELAAELVRLKVDLIAAGPTPPALAARNATRTIPIVMTAVGDPVRSGLIASLARPGGNVTGVTFDVGLQVTAKGLELLGQALPKLRRVAILANPANPSQAVAIGDVTTASRSLGLQLKLVEAVGPEAFAGAFAAMLENRAEALLVLTDPVFYLHRVRLANLATQYRLPSMYAVRESVEAGGLMCYGPSIVGVFRRAAKFIDKIFKGAKPSDLPVEQPDKFELVINLKTAKTLGLTIPPSLLLRADQVIQ